MLFGQVMLCFKCLLLFGMGICEGGRAACRSWFSTSLQAAGIELSSSIFAVCDLNLQYWL